MTDNTGRFYDFTAAEKTKLLRREKKRTDLQIKLARQKKGSRRRAKTKRKIAATYARDRRLRTAVAHRISNHLVVQAVERGCAAIGFEDLRLGNMTRRPGLNAIHCSRSITCPMEVRPKAALTEPSWAATWEESKHLQYKCRRPGLMFVQVDPAGTSLQCTACQHKDPRNRLSQADFCCVRCGHQEHADLAWRDQCPD